MNQRATDPPRPRGYKGVHRSGVDRAPGFAAGGVISDRLRSTPALLRAAQDEIRRDHNDRYTNP